MQKIVVLVAMLLLMLAMSVPALATGNNQNAQSWVVYGGSGGSQHVVFSEGGFQLVENGIHQTSKSGDIRPRPWLLTDGG